MFYSFADHYQLNIALPSGSPTAKQLNYCCNSNATYVTCTSLALSSLQFFSSLAGGTPRVSVAGCTCFHSEALSLKT